MQNHEKTHFLKEKLKKYQLLFMQPHTNNPYKVDIMEANEDIDLIVNHPKKSDKQTSSSDYHK